VILAQISDPHVTVGPEDAGSAEALEAAVAAVARFDPLPDAVLLSGDVTEHGSPEEYERVAELLEPLPIPLHAIPGNHDDVDRLRATVDGPGDPGEPLQCSVGVGSLRLVACDTTVAGEDGGALGPERLGWLEAELRSHRATPTVLAMHHPPVQTGHPLLDAISLADADRAALAELLAGSPQVKRIVCGHVHRGATGALAGCPVFVCASSYLQLALDLRAEAEIGLIREPPVIGIHVLIGSELISHVVPIGDFGQPFRLY
jgi:3',5'-cyclic AMP phosphodiesterase CpdA